MNDSTPSNQTTLWGHGDIRFGFVMLACSMAIIVVSAIAGSQLGVDFGAFLMTFVLGWLLGRMSRIGDKHDPE